MSLETLMGRLDKVKHLGRAQYQAVCPAHQDKSPSLAIKALADGRILMHCLGGCDTNSVLDAIGLSMEDLFPERIGEFKSERKPFHAGQVLQMIAREATIVALCGGELTKHPLDETDRARLFLAVSRINTGLDMAGLNHE
jgi:hypothetical protein